MKKIWHLLYIAALLKVLFIILKFHKVIWDEAVFLGMGKWIISAGQSGLWEWIRPVGLPLLLGLVNSNIILADLIILGFTLGCMILTYLIGKKIYDEKVGFIASAIVFTAPFFFEYTNRIMTGIPALFFCLLSTYMVLKKRYAMAGVAAGAAFWFRYPAALIIVAISIILIRRYKHLVRFNLSAWSMIGAYLIMNRIFYGSFLKPILLASSHQSTDIGNVTGIMWLGYYPVLIVTASIALLFALYPRYRPNLYHLAIPLCIFFFYFTIIPHKQERFAILFLPYLAILAASRLSKLKRFPYLVIGILLLQPIFIDIMTFSQVPNSMPQDVETYSVLDKIEGPILTAVPHPAAYTRNKYIQFYNNITDALEIYEDNQDIPTVLYARSSYPCFDSTCEARRDELEEKIRTGRYPVLEWDGKVLYSSSPLVFS